MSEGELHFTEEELQRYVDGRLDPERTRDLERYLSDHPAEAERLRVYQRQNETLHALFDPVVAEPLPERLLHTVSRRPRRWGTRAVAASLWLAVGGVAGWMAHGLDQSSRLDAASLPRQAAIAHIVYSAEVLHPVEVTAQQEGHLTRWLSKRLGTDVKAPSLASAGFNLVGGRLLPADRGPAAQLMYENTQGQRLTLYVRQKSPERQNTAFRYEQEGGVSVFYWVDGDMGYALSGAVPRPELLHVATLVYEQLNR